MDENDDKPAGEEERKKMFLEAGAAAERVRSGEVDSVDVELPNGTMRISRDAENPGGVRVETVGDDVRAAVTARTYPAVTLRPAAYPDTLPFLVGCAASVSEVGGGRMRSTVWMKPDDPEEAFEEVRRQVLAMGWEEGESIPLVQGMGPKRRIVFEREGNEGTLTSLALGEVAQIMWTEVTRQDS